MVRYRIEHAVVVVLSFLLGMALAICVTPGDIWLAILAGIALSFFCREHFRRNFGGELLWWPHHRRPGSPAR